MILFSSAPVFLVLLLNGYYFTRPLLGLVWKDGHPALYGALAAGLYVIQMYIGYVRLRPDVIPEAAAKVFPWLLGGASIVFFCAVIGRLQLRKWNRRTIGLRTSVRDQGVKSSLPDH